MVALSAYQFHEQEWDDYEDLYESFEWEVPSTFNVAEYLCDRWVQDGDRPAIYSENAAGDEAVYSFEDLQESANRLANVLADHGVGRGDRVGLNLPQKPETVIGHVACWKLGAVSVPLSTLFGPDGLAYRLDDAGATVCIVDESNVEALRDATDDVPDLETVLTVGDVDTEGDERDLWDVLDGYSPEFENADLDAEDDLILIYTSGTTGPPKGVRHGHRVVLGHLPSFVVIFCNMDLGEENVFWSPAEWAWVLIFDIVFPPLFYGRPILAYDGGPFDPSKAFELIEKYDVTNYFAPPTALRMMREADAERHDVGSVETIATGGEPLGEDVVQWVDDAFGGAALNEAYGQTEANLLVGTCDALMDVPQGKLGLAMPGHDVRIADGQDSTRTCDTDEVGEFAVRYEGDPVCLKEYWNLPRATERKIRDGWVLTEDLGLRDEDGYFEFHSRKDDVILSAGYRIGPGEIEESLADHDAVANAGVIAIPHDERGEVPKAFVVLADGYGQTEDVREVLTAHVRNNLAKYEYPREIEFLDELPKTVTGKVRRTDLEEREGLVE